MAMMQPRRTCVLQDVQEYWEKRSDSYSKQNIAELHSFKKEAWRQLILEHAPRRERLRILDVGTGPGFFAINLAMEGHEVTAVDCTQGMLDKAAENARNYGVSVHFALASAHELPFEEGSFDLVVSRNVVWNLEDPEAALAEWSRVLDQKGRLVYYDANWYLYLFDEKIRRIHEEAQREVANRNLVEFPQKDLGCKMEALAYDLPLSRRHRPHWDREAIIKTGLSLVKVDEEIGDRVWEEVERIRYAASPLFMVCAEKC